MLFMFLKRFFYFFYGDWILRGRRGSEGGCCNNLVRDDGYFGYRVMVVRLIEVEEMKYLYLCVLF